MAWGECLDNPEEILPTPLRFCHILIVLSSSPESGRFTTGENIYWYSTTASSHKLNADDALEAWFNEHKDFSFGAIKWEDFGGSKQVGHYTQVNNNIIS